MIVRPIVRPLVRPVVNSVTDRLSGSRSWTQRWSTAVEVLFFAETSNIADGKLYNQKKDATDYLTVAGAAGSYTFQCPDTAAYIAADTDYIWFKTDESQRTPTEAELIGYDFTRTIVKYQDASPYAIEAIMILSSDVDTAQMRDDFHLSIWWDDTLSANGNLKGNRGIGQSVWTPESVSPYTAVYDAMTNKPTEAIATAQQTLVDTIVTGGVWAKLDRFFVTAQYSNTAGESVLDWVDPTRKATEVGAPVWTTLEGFLGAAAKHLRSGYNPSVGTNKFKLNDNSFGCYQRVNKAAADQIELGSSVSGATDHVCAMELRYTGNVMLAKNCCSAWQSVANSDARGMYICTRLLSTEFKLYKNKVATTFTVNSDTLPDLEFSLLASTNKTNTSVGHTTGQDSLFFFGGGLTQADVDCLTDAFEVYMDSNGKGVIS